LSGAKCSDRPISSQGNRGAVQAPPLFLLSDLMEKVTYADFVMVALDGEGKPKPVPAE